MKSRHTSGYTLLELLVAMTILVMLGAGLVVILKQGITTWHVAEKRGGIYDRARIVLDQIAEDLRAATCDSRTEGAGFWVRFLCDRDPTGRQRLRFTRAISGEAEHPIAREGGRLVETRSGAHHDQHGDAAEAKEGRLLPPAGLMEVLYALDPDPGKSILWRGLRSPVGGAGSLFVDRNAWDAGARSLVPAKRDPGASPERSGPGVALAEGPSRPAASASRRKPGQKGELEPPIVPVGPLARAAQPFADGVTHLEFAFWTPHTDTWDRREPPRLKKAGTQRSGPILSWDSTRAVLDEEGEALPESFVFRRVEGSLEDPADDLFPERVEVTLVIAGNAEVPQITLAADAGAADRDLPLSRTDGLPEDGPGRFVRIDGEWIGYERIERGRLILPAAKGVGRGARGTAAARHAAGAAVDLGTTFRRVVEIPSARAGRVEPPEGRRRS